MLSSLRPRGSHRWPRGQRFSLSSRGAEAVGAYRLAVADARALGRAALETAQRAWGEPRGIAPQDAVVLCEVGPGRRSIGEVARALDSCGLSPADVKEAVDRLADAGLIEPSPSRSQPAP